MGVLHGLHGPFSLTFYNSSMKLAITVDRIKQGLERMEFRREEVVQKSGFPWWLNAKESSCQCRRLKRCGLNPWRRKWQPTPIFLPGKFHGQRSLAGYSPRDGRVGHDRGTKTKTARKAQIQDLMTSGALADWLQEERGWEVTFPTHPLPWPPPHLPVALLKGICLFRH